MDGQHRLAHAFAGPPSLAEALRDAPPPGRDLTAEVAGYLLDCGAVGAPLDEIARAVHARTSVVRRLLRDDDQFERISDTLTAVGGRGKVNLYRLACDPQDGPGRVYSLTDEPLLDPLAFNAGQAQLLAGLLAPLTEAAQRAEDIARGAYLDGRYGEGDAAPPGIAARTYAVQMHDVFAPLIDQLEQRGAELLAELHDASDPLDLLED